MRFLYLDFDDLHLDVEALETRIDEIADMTQTEMELLEVLSTARGYHIVVTAHWRQQGAEAPKQLEPMEIVCLQLLLGSDPKREAFNLQRAHVLGDAPAFWRDRWNVLHSEKL